MREEAIGGSTSLGGDSESRPYKDISGRPALPQGWVWTRLGEVVAYVKGKKPKNLGAGNEFLKVPYINIEAFERRIFTQFTDGLGCPLCEPSDILIVWDGARCGLAGKGVAGAIGSTLAKLVYYELDPSYVFYFLRSKYDYINSRPRGVGIPHVEPALLWNIDFPLPPLAEQQRIVAKIEELFTKLDAGVTALQKVKAQLKRYRQAVLKHAFEGKLTTEWREAHKGELEPASALLEQIKKERENNAIGRGKWPLAPTVVDRSDLPRLPAGWVWAPAEQLCDFITKGTTPKAQKLHYRTGEIPFIKVYNLTDCGLLDFSVNPTFVSYQTHSKDLTRSKVFPGDVLMNIVGPPLGKVSVVPDTYPEWNINQAIAIFRPMPGYNLKLLCFSLLTEDILSWAERRAKATAGQFNLTLEICRNLPLPVPPAIEQMRLVEQIERRFSIADEVQRVVEQSLKQADRLHQSILKKAFEGKLVPQDPSDEPADKLLERIRQAKIRAGLKPARTMIDSRKIRRKGLG